MAHHPWAEPLPEPDGSLVRAALAELSAALADAVRAAVAAEREECALVAERLPGATCGVRAPARTHGEGIAAAIRARGKA